MRRFIVAVTLGAALLGLMAPTTQASECDRVTAAKFRPFSAKVWPKDRWQRGQPKPTTVRAQRKKLRCAAGPGHRKAMRHRWRSDQRAYYEHRAHKRRCRGGFVLKGRVSWFNGPSSTTASGRPVTDAGLALNISPGAESGWYNATTLGWLRTSQLFRVTIAGHVAVLPVIDLGPNGWTHRAIDVTESGVYELGLSPGAFPTDSIGTARLIPDGCRWR